MKLSHATVVELEAHSRALDLQILKLDRRGVLLTPKERMRAIQLKKMRLVAKDRLGAMRPTRQGG